MALAVGLVWTAAHIAGPEWLTTSATKVWWGQPDGLRVAERAVWRAKCHTEAALNAALADTHDERVAERAV